MSIRTERRADRAASAEQARADRAAEREQDRADRTAEAERARADRTEQAAERERARNARAERREAARARRAARLAAARRWAGAHVVGLLIYPLGLVSAGVAIPAMAAYGGQVYGGGTGYALPLLTELGMWVFALAVQVSRVRFPARPVWALQAGVWGFAAVALGLNTLHGLSERGVSAGIVMGIASVAGVIAHQLVTAAPRRAAVERDAARLARREQRHVVAVQRAAIQQAVAELDADGHARLVYRPGAVALTRRHGRRRLVQAAVSGRPVTSVADGWDAELVALLDGGPETPTSNGDGPVSCVTGTGQPGRGTTTAEAQPPENTPAGNGTDVDPVTPDLAELVAAARAAIAAGELPARPSQRALRALLGVRTERAAQVQHALKHTREDM